MKNILTKHIGLPISWRIVLFSLSLFMVFISLPFCNVYASVTPTLSAVGLSDGDSVQLNVTGDPSSSVLFYYIKNGLGQQIKSIGNTNSSGTFTTTISSSGYGVVPGSSVHVTIGGVNGPKSADVLWPAVTTLISSSNMLSLSQTGLVLTVGQSSVLTVSNVGSSSPYLSKNSNPSIANINVSGNQITVLANSYGSTVATICLINNSSNCGSIYITVQNSNVPPLTFSQNSVSISPGQNISIQINGGSGSYLILNNSSQNQSLIQTNISGSTVTLTTTSTTGSASITVCSTNMSSCGIINVAIGTISSTAVTFSQSSPTVLIGQSLNLSIYGPSNSLFYVASNSNPSIVQVNLSGTTLTLLGITNGSSIVNVCAATNNCGSLTVTVNYNTNNSGGNLMLSQENVSLSVGQTLNITISGGAMPYSIPSTVNNIFRPTLNTNILTLYGVSSGSSLMNICSAAGNCATLSVTVVGANNIPILPTGCVSSLGFSQTTGNPCSNTSVVTTPSIPNGCTTTTLFSPINGQSCPGVSVINKIVSPIDNSSVCPNGMTVISNCTSDSLNTIPLESQNKVKTVFKFTKAIKLGSSGAEVSELQKKLSTLGFYKGKIDGGFGPSTEKAVKAFQKSHKLSQLGSVGPSTRSLLNK